MLQGYHLVHLSTPVYAMNFFCVRTDTEPTACSSDSALSFLSDTNFSGILNWRVKFGTGRKLVSNYMSLSCFCNIGTNTVCLKKCGNADAKHSFGSQVGIGSCIDQSGDVAPMNFLTTALVAARNSDKSSP